MMQSADNLALFGWRLEDFNQDIRAEAPALPEAAEAEPDIDAPITQDDWTDGYIHASRLLSVQQPGNVAKADILSALHELEVRLVESVEETSLLVARLLLDAIAIHGQEHWAGTVTDRIRRMTDLIKPALMSTIPQISIQSRDGDAIMLSAEPCLEAVEEKTKLADHVTLSWRLGKAEAGWTATLRDMASALAPLILDPHPKQQTMDAA